MSNWVGKQHHSCSEIPGYIASQEKKMPFLTKQKLQISCFLLYSTRIKLKLFVQKQ